MPVSGVRLGGALNPLSLRAAKESSKKKSLASSAAADFFPDSLPASCGALTPSGCVHAANPSPLLRLGKEEGVCYRARRGRREADSEKDGHAVQLVAEITSDFLNTVSVYMFRGKGCHLGFWKDNDQNFPLYSMVRRDVQSGQLDT